MNTENNNPSWFAKRTRLVQALIIAVPAMLILYIIYMMGWIPGLQSSESKKVSVDQTKISTENVNDKSMKTPMLEVPDISNFELAEQQEDNTQVVLVNWTWFGNAGIIAANGGPITIQNSLMNQNNVNLRMVTNNSVAYMKEQQLTFINDFASGSKSPNGAAFVTIMGDGAVAYMSSMNENIIKTFGPEYKLKIIGIVGFSMGEDCLIGPAKWMKNPKESMKGAIISTVIGDGDWVIAVRYAQSNGLNINPDPKTYDPNAVNFVPAPEDDFMKSAESVISGNSVTLRLKDENGKLGENVTKKIEGSATWFPGDKKLIENTGLVKVVSTSNYPNQMATVIVGCDKWCQENSKLVVNFLSAALTATNQIKQYNEWFDYACEVAPKVFCESNPDDCSESSQDWKNFAIPNGGKLENQNGEIVLVGGTQMANLADNKKYFGLTKKGNNVYKSVWEYCSGILRDLNPFDFMGSVKEITSYDDAVDLQYLQKINVASAQTKVVDYSKTTGKILEQNDWTIEFKSGSAIITPESEEIIKDLFNQINISENSRVELTGHTDDTGGDEANIVLSKNRANAVKMKIIELSNNSFPPERFKVDGKGESEPKVVGTSVEARKQNRRVTAKLIQ